MIQERRLKREAARRRPRAACGVQFGVSWDLRALDRARRQTTGRMTMMTQLFGQLTVAAYSFRSGDSVEPRRSRERASLNFVRIEDAL
jgi:hypothetical protein